MISAKPLGKYGRYVYTRQPRGLHPWPEPVREAPGDDLLKELASFNVLLGDLGRHILVGWEVCAIVGGALTWRPHLLVTGASGYGKSTVCDILREVAVACIWTQDASEAGLRALLHGQSLPVFWDEAERERKPNGDDSDKRRLMRIASGGGNVIRGTTDHRSVNFRIQSCFALFAVNGLPADEVDENRFVTVELGPLPDGRLPALATAHEHSTTGQKFLRLTMDRWREWPDLSACYFDELVMGRKWSRRRAEVMAAIFTGAHIVRFKGTATRDQVRHLFEHLKIERIERDDRASVPQHARALAHLLSSRLPMAGSPQHPISVWIDDACSKPDRRETAEKMLLEHGLRILRNDAGVPMAVAVAYEHRAMQEIAAAGGWRLDTLKRLGAAPGKWWFAGLQSRGVALPIALVGTGRTA